MNELAQQLKGLSLQVSALQQRQAGELSLFNAAAILGDGKAMDKRRANVHGIIDQILDLNARMFALARQV